MCAKKSVTASRCEVRSKGFSSSPVPGNTVRSGYRVLGRLSRDNRLSVDRNCAGRNVLSDVKVSSPDKHLNFVVATRVLRSEATLGGIWLTSTTGVQVHGEYRRQLLELGRSLEGRPGRGRVSGQGIKAKSQTIPTREVRGFHSSVKHSTECGNEMG